MEILSLLPWWVLLLASIVPCSIKRGRTQHMQSLVLSALFWRFELQCRRRSYSWSFSLPWIEHLQKSQQILKALRSSWIQSVFTLVKKVQFPWK